MSDTTKTELSDAKKALLQRWLKNRPAAAPGAIARRKELDRAPLSITQQRVWVLEKLLLGTSIHHVAEGLRLSGPLNQAALAQAVRALIARHEALRTTIAMDGAGNPVQFISAPPASFDLPVVDLTGLPAAGREGELKRLAEAAAVAPFDLERGPLFRLTLCRLAPEEHLLVLVFHHLISDGWSLGIFLAELAAVYNGLVTGRPAELPALPVQYGDFAEWEHARTLPDQLAYWQKQLAGKLPVLELPADRPRPPVQSYRGGTIHATASAALVAKVAALSLKHGVSPFMTWLAAWSALLHRYSGQREVLIGTPVANRSRVEMEGMIGFIANTLVMRTDLEGDPTFGELLGRVRELALGALANQELPFETLVERLNLERTMSYNPLFQAGFSLLPREKRDEFQSLRSRGLRVDNGASRCDVWLTVFEESGETALALEYNADLFTEATARRMLGHFTTLAEAAVTEPATQISALPWLSAPERQQLLVDWNQTDVAWTEGPALIHRLIEARAAEAPDRTAVICGAERLTYGELNRRANGLARRLRALGVGPDSLVGISMERSVGMVVGLLAILKSGGGYLPLDPEYPAERLSYMLEDAGVRVLLIDERLKGALPVPAGAAVLHLDQSVSDENLEGGAAPSSLAYIIYTSGSTGKPKGVMIEHRNVINLLFAMQRQPGMVPDDVLVAFTSISFDIAGLELYLPLITGATLVVIPQEAMKDGRMMVRILEETGATFMQATPVTWRLLEAVGWKPSRRLKMLIGGEPLPRDLATRLPVDGAELWNMYGPTETTIWSSVWRVDPQAATLSIGRPIANTQLYVLDAHRSPVPVGVPGELYIGGDGVARGYLNRPDVTAERFVSTEWGRLYCTGDLVRYLADGNLEFLGRVDQQLKVHGFRIEAGEVEAALARHPAVAQVAVAARPDAADELRLVAYIVPNGEVPAFADLQAFLKKTLPDYMVPAAYMALERLPLTPNGKLDRRALPAPSVSDAAKAAAYVAPRTPAEALLASIWADVLKLDRVSATANFFELGGHSLLGIRLLIRLREAFGVDLPLRVLWESPTVERLALATLDAGGLAPDDEALAGLLGELEGEAHE